MTTSNNIIGKVYSDFQKNEGYASFYQRIKKKHSDNPGYDLHTATRDFYLAVLEFIRQGGNPYEMVEEQLAHFDSVDKNLSIK